MPLFRYRALTADGKMLKGVIDADSLIVAKERLKRQEVLVTELKLHQRDKQQAAMAPQLLQAFTQELAQLLRAGLPLYESLVTIEEKYRRHKIHPMLLDLCDHLKEGHLLSKALKRYPATFDRIYLSMVQVAEQSGDLVAVFDQLTHLIQRQQKLRKQLASALAYPMILSVFCVFVAAGLFFFVIPNMQELFEGRSLHPMTQLIVGLSQWLNTHLQSLLLSLAMLATLAIFTWRRPQAKQRFYAYCLRLPFLRTLLLHSALARFCRCLAMLLTSGVPLLSALEYARDVMRSPLLEKEIGNAEKRVLQGDRLSVALKAAPHFPPLIQRLVSMAEETGKLGESFTHLADMYEDEVERHLFQLTTYLQPMLLIILGAIVGLVVLSVLLPLTDVSTFTSN